MADRDDRLRASSGRLQLENETFELPRVALIPSYPMGRAALERPLASPEVLLANCGRSFQLSMKTPSISAGIVRIEDTNLLASL